MVGKKTPYAIWLAFLQPYFAHLYTNCEEMCDFFHPILPCFQSFYIFAVLSNFNRILSKKLESVVVFNRLTLLCSQLAHLIEPRTNAIINVSRSKLTYLHSGCKNWSLPACPVPKQWSNESSFFARFRACWFKRSFVHLAPKFFTCLLTRDLCNEGACNLTRKTIMFMRSRKEQKRNLDGKDAEMFCHLIHILLGTIVSAAEASAEVIIFPVVSSAGL